MVTILIVDDHLLMRRAVRAVLAARGRHAGAGDPARAGHADGGRPARNRRCCHD